MRKPLKYMSNITNTLIELLEAEIENLNTEENDVINKYAKSQDAKKLQRQSELSAPTQ